MTNRVLFIPANPWTDWGGSEKLWVYTAKRLLRDRGLQVGVLIKNWESVNPALREVLDASKVFMYQGERSVLQRVLSKASDYFGVAAYQERVFLEATSQLRPDLAVISQGANFDGLRWMELCSKHKVPYLTIAQAATEANWLHPSEAQRLGLAYVNARHNYFGSKDTIRLTELQIGLRLANSSVVANPFDVPYEVNIDYPSVEPMFRLACVARFELHAKGQDVLLETLSDPKWQDRNLEVGIYGTGQDQPYIERLISMFGLQKRVRMMGFVPSIEIWKTDHALVMPSRFEGLPIALVEAMLCGRLAIVTNVSGNVEVIEDNVNGFVAAAPKAVYLDEALERAWAQRDQWNAIGQRAKKFIKEKMPADPVGDFAKSVLTML